MRRLHEPLTLPKHPDLLSKVNQMSIDIKLTHLASAEIKNKMKKDNRIVKPPTWEDVAELLRKCYSAINEQREDPRKY